MSTQGPRKSRYSVKEYLIGAAILAVIGFIGVTKFTAYKYKSRRQEAHTSLSAIFIAEKQFFGLHGAYVPSFEAIGYEPGIKTRYYSLGWTGNRYSKKISGYNGNLGRISIGRTVQIPWKGSPCPPNPSANAAPFDRDDPKDLIVGAVGMIREPDGCDAWVMDQYKSIRNVADGLLD